MTLEFTGPLTVALTGSKCLTDLLRADLAAIGVTGVAGITGSGLSAWPEILARLGAGGC